MSFDPTDPGPEPSELEDAVLGLLEDAGIPTAVNDQIMKLIQDAEFKLYNLDAEGNQNPDEPLPENWPIVPTE